MFQKLRSFNYKLLPLMFICAILPLIAHFYMYPEPVYSKYTWFQMSYYASDMYIHSKVTVFSVITFIMILEIVTGLLTMKNRIAKDYIIRLVPLFVYLILVGLSTAVSLDKDLALHGGFDQMEPVLILAGYALTVIYASMMVEDEKDIRLLVYSLAFGAAVSAFIGILQMFGYDIYLQAWARWFLFSAADRKLEIPVGAKGASYAALGNSNYYGTFACIVVPLTVAIAFWKTDLKKKIIPIVIAVCVVIGLVGSDSKTGMIILIFSIAIGLLFMSKPLIKKWFIVVPVIVVVVLGFVFVNIKRNGYYTQALRAFFTADQNDYELTELDSTGDCARIKYKGKNISIRFSYVNEEASIEAYEEDKKLKMRMGDDQKSNVLILSDGEEIPFQLILYSDQHMDLELKIAGRVECFKNDPTTNEYTYYTPYGIYGETKVFENALKGYEKIASGRGYIWGITIPKLKEYFLVGAGPDNFPVAIGKDGMDYALSKNTSGTAIFVRPHNYFMQMGINTGVLSLIACLVFFVWYLVDCVKLYFWKKLDSDLKITGFACMLSVIGFLGCGIANDSLISVTPLFWVALGMGMVINRWLMEEKKKNV